jgi:hypothetical protein
MLKKRERGRQRRLLNGHLRIRRPVTLIFYKNPLHWSGRKTCMPSSEQSVENITSELYENHDTDSEGNHISFLKR